MKVLIWFVVLCIPSVITTMLKKVGVGLGFLPTFLMYFGVYHLAKFLCAKWDVKVFKKEASKRGMTPEDYASSIFPPSLLNRLEASKDNRSALKNILKQSVSGEAITKSDANVLFYMFYTEPQD